MELNGLPIPSPQGTLSTTPSPSHSGEHHGSTTSPSSTTNNSKSVASDSNCHPISCVRCRKLHKKCDKKLTGCSKCASAGIECVYNSPQKRGKGSEIYAKDKPQKEKAPKDKSQKPSKKKKKTNEDENSITNNPSNSNHSTNTTPTSSASIQTTPTVTPLLTPHHVVELYFTFVCGIHPMIEKEKFKYFVNNCLPQFEKRSELHLENNIWIKSIEEMRCLYAFYLSVMTMGSHLVADLKTVDLYAKKAELEIALLSLDHSTEFYWAASCHYIYLHYVSDGDSYKAGYYLVKVNYYFNSQKEKPNAHKYFHLLEFHSSVVASRFKEDSNTFQNLMKGMSSMYYHYTNRKIEDALLPGTWEYCINTKLCQQNYILFKQVSEFIFKNLSAFKLNTMKTLTDCHSEGFFKSQRLLALFVTEGYTILFMKQIPEISYSVLEEACLKVTLLTENEVFPFVLLAAIYIVVEAAQFHIEVCKQIEKGLKPRKATVFTSAGKVITFDYFSILEKDLRALQVLAQRYRRVSAVNNDLMLEMSQLLERNNNVEMSPPVFTFANSTPPFHQIPQQDEVLARQLEEQNVANAKSEDTESFLSDRSLGPWEELFRD